MLGDVERTCDHGSCRLRAIAIGSYTSVIGEGRTAAACSPDHQAFLTATLNAQGYLVSWLEFPAKAAS